jgi:hypothetical protein
MHNSREFHQLVVQRRDLFQSQSAVEAQRLSGALRLFQERVDRAARQGSPPRDDSPAQGGSGMRGNPRARPAGTQGASGGSPNGRNSPRDSGRGGSTAAGNATAPAGEH